MTLTAPPPPIAMVMENEKSKLELVTFDMTTEQLNRLPPDGPHNNPPF